MESLGHLEATKGKTNKEEHGCNIFNTIKHLVCGIGEKIEDTVHVGMPTANVSGVHLPSINLHKAEIVVDVLITNPNPIPIPLVDINYMVDSNGRKLVSGVIPDAGTLHAHESKTINISVAVIYNDLKSTFPDIRLGSIIPYRVKVDLIVDVPIVGKTTINLEKTGEIPIPYAPDIDVEKIGLNKFSFEETVADIQLKLENKNEFDLDINKLDYEFWLSNSSVGSAELNHSAKLLKNGMTTIDIPITFRPMDFGSALWDMIRGGGATYTMKGNIDVDTPFGPMKFPISREGGTTKFHKK